MKPRRRIGLTLVLLAAVLLVPTIVMSRQWSHKARCARQLQALASAARIYADHRPADAKDAEWLVVGGWIASDTLVCPASHSRNYALADMPRLPDGGLDDRSVIAYEPEANHGGRGGNVAFADGHVAFLSGDAYERTVPGRPAGQPPPAR